MADAPTEVAKLPVREASYRSISSAASWLLAKTGTKANFVTAAIMSTTLATIIWFQRESPATTAIARVLALRDAGGGWSLTTEMICGMLSMDGNTSSELSKIATNPLPRSSLWSSAKAVTEYRNLLNSRLVGAVDPRGETTTRPIPPGPPVASKVMRYPSPLTSTTSFARTRAPSGRAAPSRHKARLTANTATAAAPALQSRGCLKRRRAVKVFDSAP
mmetsp:Transcript_71169/g.204085  ORF Transcript_71169/g.204085 Transcript_71169/m.204085 type:complete len:218 (+) Transcript_71169:41-694(+)